VIPNEEVDAFLEHYGVKGMHWGVRREGGSRREAAARSPRAKAKRLTDQELKAAVERLRLEQQFSELSDPHKKAGKKYVKKYLDTFGDKIIGGIATTASAAVVAMVFKSAQTKKTPKGVNKLADGFVQSA